MKQEYMDEQTGIYLRLMKSEDTDDIVRWRNSDAVRRNFIYREPFTPQGHESWIQNMVNTGKAVQFMICSLSDHRALGSVYIRDIDRQHRKAEYGIFIGEPTARGRGVGTAAARLMLEYCFIEEGLHKVFLRVFARNIQAIRSYEKAGFVREAYLRDDVFVDGEYCDIILMAKLNDRNS